MSVIVKPDLTMVLDTLRDNIFKSFNCSRIGIIQSFNPANQTATAQIVDKIYQEKFDGSAIQISDFPLLADCPIFMPYSNAGGLTLSVNQGDECIILFNDRDIDNWFESGNVTVPNTARAHNITDGLILVGIKSLLNSIPNYNNNATTLSYGTTQLQLTDKVHIQNATQNLRTLIDTLMDTLLNMKVLNPLTGNYTLTLDSATINSFNVLKTNFDNLLI